jgi:CDGSH-type Zn-finger protein/uncharacterized Fe-S cluster protein YjdI
MTKLLAFATAHDPVRGVPSREQLIYLLCEAAELEHTLMCTYLYAGFSLRDGLAEGLSEREAAAVARWRRVIVKVAVEEMGHLTAVWNITSALGGAPRFGRANFPIDPGLLPARIVVKLSPFDEAAIQHFVHLERPEESSEPDGEGYSPDWLFKRAARRESLLTPMALDYETVGAFYASLAERLRAFVEHHGEAAAFAGDPALQLSSEEVALMGTKPVICLKTALAACASIVEQGEGAQAGSRGSHFRSFVEIRDELAVLKANNPGFQPAFPAAHNPVLRPPLVREGRVWIENKAAARVVDVANAGYWLMLRLLAYSYVVPRPNPEKALAVELALGLMHAVTPLAELAARLPAGPSNPTSNAGVSLTAPRDAASLPPGPSSRRFFSERLAEMARAAGQLDQADARIARATRILVGLAERGARTFESLVMLPPTASAPVKPAQAASEAPPIPRVAEGVEHIAGKSLTLLYDGKKCIHARLCVTGGPSVFLANVKGPWIHPDTVPVESLVEIAHACPSGAIRYRRTDGKPDEVAPPVNLLVVREAGPYAVRAELQLAGKSGTYRATLCRCGASNNKPYCDGSHHEIGFSASGEPPTTRPDSLDVRNGPLVIELQTDGPLQVRGNLEITSGTGRVVARVAQTRLCRCGASNTKPFCDGSHVRTGFKSI